MLKKILPYLAAMAVFLLLCAAYFFPELQGKELPKGDLDQWRGMIQEKLLYEEQTGETVLWTNSMFGGMPTYQISSIRDGNAMTIADKALRLWIPSPIGQFFLAMLSFYIMLVVLRVNPWLSIIGAVAFGFSTNNFILYEAGQISKLGVVCYLPLIIAGMVLTFRSRYLLGGAIFSLGMGLALWTNHPQMLYYFILTAVIFGIAQLVKAIREKQLLHFGKAVGMLLLGSLLALGSTASNVLPTLEYTEDTMRGNPILAPEGTPDPNNSSETEGLAWNYAMNWSNGFLDLFASFIPGVVGGGSNEMVSRDSEIGRDLTRRGARLPEKFAAPLYWGSLPSTSGPIYFGAVVCFLFLMGITLVKGPVKWWLALGTLLTFMLSMGSNLEWFNRILFEHFPLYNKFRAHNSVLSVTSVLVTALGFLAVARIIRGEVSKPEVLRSLWIAGGISLAICLFFILLGPGMFDFTAAIDAQIAETFQPELLQDMRKSWMRADALRTLLLVALAGGAIWAYVQQKIEKRWLLIGLGLLILFDLWTVGRRYLDADKFVPAQQYQASFSPRPVDTQILQDQDPHYRVLDLSENTFNSTRASYFHKSIGGYHAAKLQRYDDLIRFQIARSNQAVLNMLNTKYIIQPGPEGQPVSQRNPAALGNAWFIDTIRMVANANAEINGLTGLNPAREVLVHQEFQDYVTGLDPTPNGSIQLTDYAPDKLTYQSNTSSEQLAVFSEIWYGPDKGWQAYIDDEPVDHIRVNYVLRALRVPAGQHTITFEFSPGVYRSGVTISLISSLIILLSVLGIVGYYLYQFWQRNQEVALEPVVAKKPKKKTTAKRKKRK